MLLLSLLPIVSVFRPGAYESGDFNIHTYRTIAFVEAIKDGQILPSWPKDLNATYGYPLFIWMNSLTYYLISLFKVFGFDYIMSTKLYLVFSYIVSGIAFWFFAKQHIKNLRNVFVATIFYLFVPYHFVDLHFRAAIGETLSFVLLPLFLLSIFFLWKKQTFFNAMILGLVWGLFILTHHAISVFSLGIGIPYLVFLLTINNKNFVHIVKLFFFSLVLGFLISLYVWWPHVFMAQYTYGYKLSNPMVSFPTISDLLFSPYRYGLLFQGPNGELSFAIGYTQLLMVLLGFGVLIRQKISKDTASLLFFIIIFICLVFMMNPISSFVWNTVPLIKSAQFSTRLMVIMSLTTSMVAGLCLQRIKVKNIIVYGLVVITVGYTVLNWGHRRVIPEIDDTVLKKQLWLSTAQGEGFQGFGNPKWIDFNNQWIDKKPNQHIEILEGEGTTKLIERTSIMHKYTISAKSDLLVRENTLYFPGWKASIYGKDISIGATEPSFPGVITLNIPKGNYELLISYSDILDLLVVKLISVTFFILTLVYFVLFFVKKRINTISNK